MTPLYKLKGHKIKGHLLTLVCVLSLSPYASAASLFETDQSPSQPKLVLQITVDALRGDLPARYMKNMGEGGFRYLMDEGLFYSNAHYQHANTETVVGHVSLATGAPPSVHGMVGNVWFDRNKAVKFIISKTLTITYLHLAAG